MPEGYRDVKQDPRKFIVFVDSLGYDDVEDHMEYVRENAYDGTMDAGSPYVTPKVLGEIYTGENPGKHGLPSISRYDQDNRVRPALPTLPEIVAEDDTYENVANYGLPFILSPNADPTGEYWHMSDAMGQQAFFPPEAQGLMQIPGPAGDLSDPNSDDELLINHRLDHVQSTFATARSLATIQDFDVMFISCRIPDSYCHYRFTHVGEGETLTDRQIILQQIDTQIKWLSDMGDVFVFGDHGATELDHVFKINRWLMDNGFLEVDIDEDFYEKLIDRGVIDEPDEPGTVYQVGMPHIEIDEDASVAISDDPFSGGITLLDGADEDNVREMIDGLEATPHVDEVEWSAEKWDGELLNEAPDLYCRRAVGSFISGNLSEEMGGPEITRSGVHHPYGAWGATTDVGSGDIDPQDVFTKVLDFLGIDPPEPDPDRDYGVAAEEREGVEVEHDPKDNLRDLGYL